MHLYLFFVYFETIFAYFKSRSVVLFGRFAHPCRYSLRARYCDGRFFEASSRFFDGKIKVRGNFLEVKKIMLNFAAV